MAALYTDHNVARALARLLQARSHTVTTAHDLGLDGASDDEHLLVAAQHGWTLITNNRDDFVLLHNAWRRWASAWQVPAQHHGVIITRQTWPTIQAAEQVDILLQVPLLLINRLYRWHIDGWVSTDLQ